MAENQQDSYVAEIANSDNEQEVNSSEQIALDFLSAQKGKLPPEQFKRLLDSTILILQRKWIEKDTIRGECEKALQELLLSIDKRNRITETEQFLVQKLNLKKDENISSQEVSKKIQSLSDIQIKEISDFLLKTIGPIDGFCPDTFGCIKINIFELYDTLNQTYIEKQKELLNTKMLAFIESKWKTKEEAQKMVDEIHQWPQWIHTCNTSMLQHILEVLKKHGIKDIDFNDKDSLVDIIKTKVDIEEKKNEWKLRSFGINPEDINNIKTEEDALKLAAINKLDPEETQQLLQALERKQQIQKKQKNAEIIWNTNATEFNYLIQTLQNGGDPKAVMQGVKSMQEERLNQEKLESSGITMLAVNQSIALPEIGKTVSYRLSMDDDNIQNMIHITSTSEGLYELQIANHKRVTLTEKETEWYIHSFQFLEDTGLGYLVRNIRPKMLSEIIALSGKNGHRVDNKDGDFTESERFYFLKTLGKVLGIEGMNETINFAQSKELLEKTFYQAGSTTEWGFEKIATKIGLIRNGGFKIDEFTQRIKQA